MTEMFVSNRFFNGITDTQKRDSAIKQFLAKAGFQMKALEDTERGGSNHEAVALEKGGSQRLYKSEIPIHSANWETEAKFKPYSDRIRACFDKYASRKDESGYPYMTVADMQKFVVDTQGGEKDPPETVKAPSQETDGPYVPEPGSFSGAKSLWESLKSIGSGLWDGWTTSGAEGTKSRKDQGDQLKEVGAIPSDKPASTETKVDTET
jgi:hypothetical protein